MRLFVVLGALSHQAKRVISVLSEVKVEVTVRGQRYNVIPV